MPFFLSLRLPLTHLLPCHRSLPRQAIVTCSCLPIQVIIGLLVPLGIIMLGAAFYFWWRIHKGGQEGSGAVGWGLPLKGFKMPGRDIEMGAVKGKGEWCHEL